MADLTKDEIRAMGKAVGLDIQDPELTEVMYSLNALLESLDAINPPGLNDVEPLPIILPPACPFFGTGLSKMSLLVGDIFISRPHQLRAWRRY